MKDHKMGSWESEITPDMVIEERVKFNQILVDQEDIYWSELRPFEEGRTVLVRYNTKDNSMVDLLEKSHSAKTKVYEYGGGEFFLGKKAIYFTNQKDQRLYLIQGEERATPISPNHETRFAEGVFDEKRNKIYCIQEKGKENFVVAIDPITKSVTRIIEGKDFYSSLRLSPDGNQLAYLSWNHPNMPWDETHLYVAHLDDEGSITKREKIAGGDQVSIFQPEWSLENELYYVSDRTGFWNLYRYENGESKALYPMEADFGMPQWQMGYTSYTLLNKQDHPYLVVTYVKEGTGYLGVMDLKDYSFKTLSLPFTHYHSIQKVGEKIVFIGSSPMLENAIVDLDPFSEKWDIVKKSAPKEFAKEWISTPKMITFPTTDNDKAHAVFYPPKNPSYKPKGEKTPLIIRCHGGPTAHVMPTLQIEQQYWTSRGFAYVELNYRGSTGYGRTYRDKLKGKWGIYDVDDAVYCAKYLAEQKMIDPRKTIIKGGSAGGYTTLAALTFRDVFQTGASYYGVSDLEALTKETHKFEQHYLDGLVGKYPEEKNLYYERSPIHFIDALNVPVILLQGSEDKIVPPSQSERVYESLKKKGIMSEYILFEGEGHGFRMGENKKTSLIRELAFYQKVLGLE